LTATAKSGFVFTEWTSSLGATITNAHFKFQVGEDESFVAHFEDEAPPKVNITTPTANEKIATAALTVKGTDSDNAGVAAVYYKLNTNDWQLASTSNNFKTWFANVTLAPKSTNLLSAYAVDTSGNASTNGPVRFFCTSSGIAAASLEGQLAAVSSAGQAGEISAISFAAAVYVKMPAGATDTAKLEPILTPPRGLIRLN
jgi:hypothetical protein